MKVHRINLAHAQHIVARLLEHAVPISEYVLMSDALHQELARSLGSEASQLDEDVEGIGPQRTFYVELGTLVGPHEVTLTPSFLGKLLGWLRMTFRTLPY